MSQPNSAEELQEAGVPEEQPVLTEQPQPEPEIPTQKQRTNVYTVMLIISFLCITTACILLYMELTRWGAYPWWNTSEGTPNVQSFHWVPESPLTSDRLTV